MLNRLFVNGYKSLNNIDIGLANLTLLAGLNSSGKSSIIQAIRILSRGTVEDPIPDELGGISQLYSAFSKEKEITIRAIDDKNFEYFSILSPDHFQEDPEFYDYFTARYLSAERLGPRFTLPLAKKDKVREVGSLGEYVIQYIDQYGDVKLNEKMIYNSKLGNTLLYNTQAWLNEISPGIEFKHHLNEKYRIGMPEYDGHAPTNVGFGLSYVLPVIVATLHQSTFISQNDILLIENPEAHLHPRGQTQIGRLIALACSVGAQIVIETHSDHVMDGIRLAIKDKLLNPDQARFHYFTFDKEQGTTVASPDIDETGKLSFWPAGFFDQGLKNKAALSRR